ncbi:MAG: hypothetical protein LBO69_02380 [Ignavibacteria bacterium]|jgi:hypothetical protein|nr:hypothetical protein [Ignavibacteria bacterium]
MAHTYCCEWCGKEIPTNDDGEPIALPLRSDRFKKFDDIITGNDAVDDVDNNDAVDGSGDDDIVWYCSQKCIYERVHRNSILAVRNSVVDFHIAALEVCVTIAESLLENEKKMVECFNTWGDAILQQMVECQNLSVEALDDFRKDMQDDNDVIIKNHIESSNSILAALNDIFKLMCTLGNQRI